MSSEDEEASSSLPNLRLLWNFLEVSVEQGDITSTVADVILTTCDPLMVCSHGAAKAITLAGGDRLRDSLMFHAAGRGYLEGGQVLALNAGNLNAWCVLFVCPCRDSFHSLRDCYSIALQEAMHLGATTVALPGFGTGNLGVPVDVSAAAAFSAIFDTGLAFGSIKSIRIVDIDACTVSAFREELRKKGSELTGAVLSQDDDVDSSGSSTETINDENRVRDGFVESFTRVVLPASEQSSGSESGESIDDEDVCAVCLDRLFGDSAMHDVVQLKKCGHTYHRSCLKEVFARLQAQCPLCKRWYGAPRGNQPVGSTMTVVKQNGTVPGFSDASGFFCIEYNLPGGVQTFEHPRPGVRFSGVRRFAYLPNNPEGRRILELFKVAFANRLMFTVGDSVTTGRRNVVTFNGIHNKTSLNGGPQNCGFPDPTYFERVRQQLAAVGITDDLLDAPDDGPSS